MRSLEQVNIRTNIRTYVLTYIRTGQTLYPLHNFVVRGDNNYKAARNTVTYELRHAKYNYEKELASKIKSNNKIFWNYVHSKSKIKSSVSKLQMKNGSLSSSDQETATTQNSYFTCVFEPKIDKPLPDFPVRPYNAPLNDIDITEKHVEKAINVLEPGKSQGPDNFHPKFLMETKHQVKMPLKTIFNKSLNESKLPDIWKTANVSAIFKKGESKNLKITDLLA